MPNRVATSLGPEDEVSHYRIVAPLGAGGMGEVYLAEDRSLGRSVALKILPPDLVRNEERVRRFTLEARSASSLSHPSIVAIYEIGADAVRPASGASNETVHFIAMELVRGKTLATLIHGDKTDLKTLLGYLAQAAEGLAKAHAAGIVHRDLKPGNIMVTGDGFAKVLDFGLAKLSERPTPDMIGSATTIPVATTEGVIVGTAGYMSPEQVQGAAVDPRSDIFSFGCILYEAATRQQPFAAASGVETMHRILADQPVAVETLNPATPSDLRRLIRRCFAKKPDQRLQSMKDLALELHEIVDAYETLVASTAAASAAGSGAIVARRGPRTLPIAIVALAVMGGLVALWLRQSRRPATPFETMEMTTVTNRGDVVACALSADGRYLAYVAGVPTAFTLHVRQIATGSDVEVASGPFLQIPAFSPDGNYVYYLTRKPETPTYRELARVPALGGTPQRRAFDVDSRVTFAPSSDECAFWRHVTTKSEHDLVVLDLESGKERVLAVVSDRDIVRGAPDWSPDGKQIAAAILVATGRVAAVVALFDARTGRRHDQVSLPGIDIRDLAWLRDGSGFVVSSFNSFATASSQLMEVDYPGNRTQRVTNDLSNYSGVSIASGDQALAAVRELFLENIWLADAGGGGAHAITRVVNGENSPFDIAALDSATVVYSAPGDRGVQLWAMNAPGGEPRALTSGPMFSRRAMAGAGHVVFGRADSAGVHVWTVSPDGSGLRQLTFGAGEALQCVTRDGRFAGVVHFDALGTGWLLSIADGSEKPIATGLSGGVGFSPDDRHLLLTRSEPGPDGMARRKWLTFPTGGGAPVDSVVPPPRTVRVQWSHDGRGILYAELPDSARNVFRLAFGARSPQPVTRFSDGRVLDFAVSPDGRRIAIHRRVGAAENVWVTDADGSHPVQVTQFGLERVFEMAWMTDSRRLAIGAGTITHDAVVIRHFR